jgi:uncharacterized membrane protein YgdD (TMEM256/DUF423 family)
MQIVQQIERKFLITGSIAVLIAVILGAMGAHALKQSLPAEQLMSFETGVRYQIYHGLALLIISIIPSLSRQAKNIVYYLFVMGMILFSFSIYMLSTTAITGLNVSFLGPVTPIGGLLLITGWIYLIIKFISIKAVNNS